MGAQVAVDVCRLVMHASGQAGAAVTRPSHESPHPDNVPSTSDLLEIAGPPMLKRRLTLAGGGLEAGGVVKQYRPADHSRTAARRRLRGQYSPGFGWTPAGDDPEATRSCDARTLGAST